MMTQNLHLFYLQVSPVRDESNNESTMADDKSSINTSLSALALSAWCATFSELKVDAATFPDHVLLDLYNKLYENNKLCVLASELSKLEIMEKLLRVNDKTRTLHRIFGGVMTHAKDVTATLGNSYSQFCTAVQMEGKHQELGRGRRETRAGPSHKRHRSSSVGNRYPCERAKLKKLSNTSESSICQSLLHMAKEDALERCTKLGMRLGAFLTDAGWFTHADQVYTSCMQLMKRNKKGVRDNSARFIECGIRLMHARTQNHDFQRAQNIYPAVNQYIQNRLIANKEIGCYKAVLYAQYCVLKLAQGHIDAAQKYCSKAREELEDRKLKLNLNPLIVVDVYRKCSRVYATTGDMYNACLTAMFAYQVATAEWGSKHHKLADALTDYAFYLGRIGDLQQAQRVLEHVLDVRTDMHGACNLHVAMAHKDLAGCLHQLIREGEPTESAVIDARKHANKSIEIMKSILPPNHDMHVQATSLRAAIIMIEGSSP